MKQLETAILSAGLVKPSQTASAKAARAAAKKAAQARRTALICRVMPTGDLFKALAKAKSGKRSQKAAKAAIDAAQAEILACNTVLRGAV